MVGKCGANAPSIRSLAGSDAAGKRRCPAATLDELLALRTETDHTRRFRSALYIDDFIKLFAIVTVE